MPGLRPRRRRAAGRRGAAIGVFGGTFDPPHLGHLALAEWAREQLDLDAVIFVPAGEPPHKTGRVLSAAADRLAMTRRAVRGHPGFRVSAHEVRSAGPSFTVDTLRWLAERRPAARLHLLIGADSLEEFPTWHEAGAILGFATLAVAARPGAGSARARHWARRHGVVWLGNPGLDVSSSLVRRRAASGGSLRYLVPDAVRRYIALHHLYARRRQARVPERRRGLG